MVYIYSSAWSLDLLALIQRLTRAAIRGAGNGRAPAFFIDESMV